MKILVHLLLALSTVLAFSPPTKKARLQAIGPINKLPANLRIALQPDSDFSPIPNPGPYDWLTVQKEPGQTYAEYVNCEHKQPDSIRHILYLQPVGDMQAGKCPSMESLRQFASCFFFIKVVVLGPLDLAQEHIITRKEPTYKRQLLATDLLAILQRTIPHDAYAVLGITMEDLYPEPDWNFCYGFASLQERVGVYSFARYNPEVNGESITVKNQEQLMLLRSCKILAHEGLHMFGIQHCIYFHCVENGCNNLAEFDSQPLLLCPVDLRKLQRVMQFDVITYYKDLSAVFRSLHFDQEEKWLNRRIDKIRKSDPFEQK